jgi:hypothetical protein
MKFGYRRGNKVTVATTQSGKSYAEVHDILAAADGRNVAIVAADPHKRSLARNALQHLVARGHKGRILWDELDELEHSLKYRFHIRSQAANPARRAHENRQQAEQLAELLCRRREMQSLATSPLTEEWTLKAILFLLNQPRDYLTADLRYVFRVGHPIFGRLLQGCNEPDIRYEFDQIACGAIKPGQYSAAQRLINGVCESPAFIARCGTALDLGTFLDRCGILLVEGGAVSQPVLQTILGSIILQTIHYVRTRHRPVPRVLLVLDEATNANLVGAAGHEVRALAECQKMGLDIHVLVQSLNFPNSQITDGVLTNCTRHEWMYAANAAVARKAADDLGDSDLEDAIRRLGVGERYVKERDQVWFETVPELPNPWVLPQLAARKTQRAIEEIRQRPEYGNQPCSPGASATSSSSDLPPDTSAGPGISEDISPARRRRTAASKSSAVKDCSGSSDRSLPAMPDDQKTSTATDGALNTTSFDATSF